MLATSERIYSGNGMQQINLYVDNNSSRKKWSKGCRTSSHQAGVYMSAVDEPLCEVSLLGAPPELTDRERQVLESVWDGYSTRAIALALKTDIRLVEAGRNGLMRKFGVNNSMELVRLALRYGILNV